MPKVELTEADVLDILESVSLGATMNQMRIKYKTGPKMIDGICRGRTWRHVFGADHYRRIIADRYGWAK